jgi:hypothetical protein
LFVSRQSCDEIGLQRDRSRMIPSSGVVDGDGCKVDGHNLLFVSYSKNRGKTVQMKICCIYVRNRRVGEGDIRGW